MKRKNLTRNALFTSIISLLLCVSMLVGTTFAWFTDSVASGVNNIISGNLDIEVSYTVDGENWADLNGATDLFPANDLWEPGFTRVVALKIENKGNLALKYAANMNIVNEATGKTKDGADIILSDILTVSTLVQQANDAMGIGDIALGLAFNGENSVGYENTAIFKAGNVLRSDVELHPGDAHYMIVKVDMAETVGNEANHDGTHVPTINFGINVLATQFAYEMDSFGSDYDKDADLGDVNIERGIVVTDENKSNQITITDKDAVEVKFEAPLNNAIVNNGGEAVISNGTVNHNETALTNYGDITMTNVDVDVTSTSSYANKLYDGSVTEYNNVDIVGMGGGVAVYPGATAEFNSGSVTLNSGNTSARHVFYAADSKLTIRSGEFKFNPTNLTRKGFYICAVDGAVVEVLGGNFAKPSTRSSATASTNYATGFYADATSQIIIKGGTFAFDPSNWVAAGYQAVQNGGTWTVTAA